VHEGSRRGLTKQVDVEPCASSAFPRPAPRPAYSALGLERARAEGLRMPHWTDALITYLDEEVQRRA
jgi:dTDP-4-dehydrorhamnose reductase